MFRPRSLVVVLFAFSLGASSLFAGDLRIPLPKRSKYTPVQKLNRDGVSAVEHHDHAKAKKLFYKAYLIDPNDPFTLNNLGYLAELEGETDRAQRFYQLAAEQNSEAIVDKASNDSYEGKPVSAVAGNAEDKGIKINRLNSQAIALLNKDRAAEADLILQKALVIDSKNPFTLNNLGYAKEKEGELDAAYQFYTAAASTRSGERVEIAPNKDWRGRRISEVAADSARSLSKRLRNGDDVESRVAILNLRGVSAMNRNDRRAAREFIQQAFKLNPNDAFTLNNMGYLAELDNDRETADYYYDRARDASGNKARIALATRKDVEGKRIGELAENTDNEVLGKIELDRIARQQMGGPVMLRKRDNTPVVEPLNPVSPPRQVSVSDANGNLMIPVRNSSEGSQNPVSGDKLMMPLPDQQQPVTVHEGQDDGGLLMPLPEDQQPDAQQPDGQQPNAQPQQPGGLNAPISTAPPATRVPSTSVPAPTTSPQTSAPPPTRSTPQQSAPATQTQQQNAAPAQSAPKQEQPGLLLPLPDNQQPPEAQSPNSQAQTQALPPQAQSTTSPSGNIGVYTPPPARTTPAPAPPPKKISDTDLSKPMPSVSNVKKISDQN